LREISPFSLLTESHDGKGPQAIWRCRISAFDMRDSPLAAARGPERTDPIDTAFVRVS